MAYEGPNCTCTRVGRFLLAGGAPCSRRILLCVASPNIPRHAPVRNARPRPLAAGGLASLEPRRRFRRHPPQRALPVAECGALYAAPVFGGGPGFPPLSKLDLSAQMHGFPNTRCGCVGAALHASQCFLSRQTTRVEYAGATSLHCYDKFRSVVL